MSPPPPPLMEELVEEILLRLPPQDPASLVRAALVCKPWRRLVACPRFRRRFLEFHRTHPMLGFFCNHFLEGCSFVRTGTAAAASPRRHAKSPHWIALDARHGRVLLWDSMGRRRNVLELVVWDPITDEQRWLPVPPRPAMSSNMAVLCAGAGDCNHFDCHRGPFLVVLVDTEPAENMLVCTYSSDADAWSDPIPTQRPDGCNNQAGYSSNVLLGNSLYFRISSSSAALKFDMELREVSWVQLPVLHNCLQRSVLTTTDDGGLGLVTIGYSDGASKLCVWLRKDIPKANAGWTQSKAIDLSRLLPAGSHSSVVGFANGLHIVFVKLDVDGALYTIDLKTYMVKKVYRGTDVHRVFPYMSFCLPALKAACLDEEPSVASSSA